MAVTYYDGNQGGDTSVKDWSDPTNWWPAPPGVGDLVVIQPAVWDAQQVPNVEATNLTINDTVWLRNEGGPAGPNFILNDSTLAAGSWQFCNGDVGPVSETIDNSEIDANTFVGSGQATMTVDRYDTAKLTGWVGIANANASTSDTFVLDGSLTNAGVIQAGINGTANVVMQNFPEDNGQQVLTNNGILRADPGGHVNINDVNAGEVINTGDIIAAGGTVTSGVEITQSNGGTVDINDNGVFVLAGQMTGDSIQFASGTLEFARQNLFTSQVDLTGNQATFEWNNMAIENWDFSQALNSLQVTVQYPEEGSTMTYAIAFARDKTFSAADFSQNGNQLVYSHTATS